MGRIGVKVWIYKGDIVPAREQAEVEEMAPIQVTLRADEPEEVAEEERQEDAAAETD
jgi:ribosomal protein S3